MGGMGVNKQKKLAKQNTPLYKRVPTLNLVDYSDIKVPLVVIYKTVRKIFRGKWWQEYGTERRIGQRMFTANMKTLKDAKMM